MVSSCGSFVAVSVCFCCSGLYGMPFGVISDYDVNEMQALQQGLVEDLRCCCMTRNIRWPRQVTARINIERKDGTDKQTYTRPLHYAFRYTVIDVASVRIRNSLVIECCWHSWWSRWETRAKRRGSPWSWTATPVCRVTCCWATDLGHATTSSTDRSGRRPPTASSSARSAETRCEP